MSAPPDRSNVYKQLRDKAEAKLLEGTKPADGHWTMGVDALRLLYQLSSNPDRAQDALKLLHELQVHQMELDLQIEEIASNERSLVEDLNLYRTFFDSAPLAYFLVDLKGTIIQGNPAAAELFGVGQDDLEGLPLHTLLLAESKSTLADLLKRVAQTSARDSCTANTSGGEQSSQCLHLMASTPPGSEHILLACCECASAE